MSMRDPLSLRSCSQDTVIEDVIELIAPVPGAVKRHFDLIHELDGVASKELGEIEKAEAAVAKKVGDKLEKTKDAKDLGSCAPPAKEFAALAEKRRRVDALSDEKLAVAAQTEALVSRHIDVINGELAALSEHLHATGEFEAVGAARPGDEVAIRLDDYDKDAWILARVVRYKAEVARYDVADADDDRKVYELSESRVVPLTDSGRGVPQAHVLTGVVSCLATIVDGEAANRLQKGDEVFAVYPDTTSFYHAVVSMPARRAGAGNAVCHCQFQDDQDETGMNPDRAVPLKYIMRSLV